MGGATALSHLRDVGRALHAWVIPHEACISHSWQEFKPDGTLKDRVLADRILQVGREVAIFAYLHSNEHAIDFLHYLEQSRINPGGDKATEPGDKTTKSSH